MNKQDSAGNTALHYAGSAGAAKLLLESGSILSMEIRNKSGETALLAACRNSRADVCDVLLKSGADIDAKFEGGNTIFTFLTKKPQTVDILKLFIPHMPAGHLDTHLLRSAHAGNFSAVYALLDAGAQIEAKDNLGFTALMLGVISLSDSNGAPFRNTFSGFGGFRAASEVSPAESYIKTLIEKYGADVNATNSMNGKTVLLLALEKGLNAKVHFLLKHAVDVEIASNTGETCLMIAAKNGDVDILKALIHKIQKLIPEINAEKLTLPVPRSLPPKNFNNPSIRPAYQFSPRVELGSDDSDDEL